MSAVGITENIRGDSKKFEVWYNGREEVYIIQVWIRKMEANCIPKFQTAKKRLMGSPAYSILILSLVLIPTGSMSMRFRSGDCGEDGKVFC